MINCGIIRFNVNRIAVWTWITSNKIHDACLSCMNVNPSHNTIYSLLWILCNIYLRISSHSNQSWFILGWFSDSVGVEANVLLQPGMWINAGCSKLYIRSKGMVDFVTGINVKKITSRRCDVHLLARCYVHNDVLTAFSCKQTPTDDCSLK